ncbi:MAG: pseudouridine synthase [Burkholderiaceae bacterium]
MSEAKQPDVPNPDSAEAGDGHSLRTAFNRRRNSRGRRGKRGGREGGEGKEATTESAGSVAGADGAAGQEAAATDTKAGDSRRGESKEAEGAPARPARRRSRSRSRRKSADGQSTQSGQSNEPELSAEDLADPLPQIDVVAAVGSGKPSAEALATVADDSPKLHKVLADAGFGSRREMEEVIVAGRVSVNGQPAHIGQRVGAKDQVRVNGRPIKRKPLPPAPRVLLMHKPAGLICSRDDPGKRPTVFDKLPKVKAGRWISVGRLDFNTEGLLIFTTAGDLANKLMHPRYGWEREYAVRVLGRIDDEAKKSLLEGVDLADGTAQVSVIEELGGDGANAWYRVVISEGRNREIRRLMEHVGLTVSRLVRVRFGPVGLPRKLGRNRWQELSPDEIGVLMQAVREAAAVAAATDPENPKYADEVSAADGDDESGEEPHTAEAAGDEGFFADPYADDDEEYPDDAQPLHLFPADDVDPRFAKLSAAQLEDDDWQPAGANAHQEGITKTVRETMAAMKTPGTSRRAARRGQGAGGTVWAGGPMDRGGDEAGGGQSSRKGNKSGKGGSRRKAGAAGQKRGKGGGAKSGGNKSDGQGRSARGGAGRKSGGKGPASASRDANGNRAANGSRGRTRGPRRGGRGKKAEGGAD